MNNHDEAWKRLARGKPTGTLKIEGSDLKWGNKTAKIVYVNEALLKAGWPNDMVAYPIVGHCMAPQILSEDLLVVAHGAAARDGDIVMAAKKKKRFWGAYHYRDNGKDIWLETNYGRTSLKDCSIIGVVLFVGRFPFELERIEVELVAVPIAGIVKAENISQEIFGGQV